MSVVRATITTWQFQSNFLLREAFLPIVSTTSYLEDGCEREDERSPVDVEPGDG